MTVLPGAVLFDMDGTLIDSEPLWLQAEHWVMERLGGTWSDEDQEAMLGGPLERAVEYMIAKAGGGFEPDAVMGLLLDIMEELLRTTPLVWQPGARELLTDARVQGVPTALVSASWARLIDAVSDRIESDIGQRAFDLVVAGDDVTQSKPHPEPYLTAAKTLGSDVEHCMVLEDSTPGIASGLAAGCRVVAIPRVAVVVTGDAFVISSLEGWTVESLWSQVRLS